MHFNQDGKVELTEEEFTEIDNMIVGIASRYHGWAGLDRDSDIVPELWCTSLAIIKRKEIIEMNYLARACFNTCIDLFDKAKKASERSMSVDNTLFDEMSRPIHNTSRHNGFRPSANYDASVTEDLTLPVVDELLSLFPEDSREYTYIKMNVQWSGLVEGDPGDIGFKRKEYRTAIACGYASDTSSGYRSMVSRVRNAIKDHYTEYRLSEDALNHLSMSEILSNLDIPSES